MNQIKKFGIMTILLVLVVSCNTTNVKTGDDTMRPGGTLHRPPSHWAPP